MYKKRTYQRRGRKGLKGRKNKFGQKKSRYADVHSFKLQSNEQTIYSNPQVGVSNVSTSGPGISIGNLSILPNSKARFGGVMTFQINQCTQWTQFNTLFDRYKIHGCKVRFIPEFNVSDTVGAGILPVIKLVHDYDDSSIPTVGDVWARQGKEYRLNKPVTVYLRPKVANMLYRTAVASAYSVAKAPYINSSYPDVPHYALKFAVKDMYAPTSNANIVIRVETTFYVSFREQLNIGAVGHTGQEPQAELEQNAEMVEDVACELEA